MTIDDGFHPQQSEDPPAKRNLFNDMVAVREALDEWNRLKHEAKERLRDQAT